MNIQEIEAKSILRKHKKIDSWFISRYGMNLYRGCIHNCAYCDGRSENYYVDGNLEYLDYFLKLRGKSHLMVMLPILFLN
jgi:DNA repair photolyase